MVSLLDNGKLSLILSGTKSNKSYIFYLNTTQKSNEMRVLENLFISFYKLDTFNIAGKNGVFLFYEKDDGIYHGTTCFCSKTGQELNYDEKSADF